MKKILPVKIKYFLLALAAAGLSVNSATGQVNIKQVPQDAELADGNKESKINAEDDSNSNDYQNEILNNPEINEHARTQKVLEKNKFNGNVATITQSGSGNKSSVTQSGNGNYAKQTQKGKHNELYLKQDGKNNSSIEKQSGYYNHKVIIQNGDKKEETIIENNEDNQE